MLVVVALLRESLPTYVAIVRLLTSVNSYVVDEVPCLIEFPTSVVVLSNEVPKHSACTLIVLVRCLVFVVLHGCNVSLLNVVVLRWSTKPFRVGLVVFVSKSTDHTNFIASSIVGVHAKVSCSHIVGFSKGVDLCGVLITIAHRHRAVVVVPVHAINSFIGVPYS